MKAIIDTSVWVSYLLTQGSSTIWLLALWREKHFKVVTSNALRAELAEVLERPNIAPRVNPDRKLALVRRLRQDAIWTPGTLDVSGATQDPEDEMLVSAALETGAQFIITWDGALLAQGSYSGVRFMTPDEFVAVVRSPADNRSTKIS